MPTIRLRLLWLILAASLWLLSTPYIGIDHDARLYMLMAIRHLHPASYARDPWFAFESQDSWSIFSPALAQGVSFVGVEGAAILATLLQGGLYVLACALLAKTVTRGSGRWLICLLLVSVPLCYSPLGMLNVREGFVTARGFAVPLSLFGLFFALRVRWWQAIVCHFLALMLHPIMAVGPVAVSCLLWRRGKWPIICVIAGLLGFAGLLGLAAAGKMEVMTVDWLSFVEPARLVFIPPWLESDGLVLLSWCGTLFVASRWGAWRVRRLYAVGALVAALGVLFSVVVAEFLPVVLVLQAQLWRVVWLAKLLTVIALADLALKFLLRRHSSQKPLAGLLMSIAALNPASVGWLLMALDLLMTTLPRQATVSMVRALEARKSLVWMACAVLLSLAIPGIVVDWSFVPPDSSTEPNIWLDSANGFVRTGGGGLLAVALWYAAARLRGGLTLVLFLPIPLMAVMLWDIRSPVQKDIEKRYTADGSRSLFRDRIPPGATVYWHRASERVWLELGTAGYASTTHATGMVFSKKRSMQLSSRLVRVAVRSMEEEAFKAAAQNGDLLPSALRTAGEMATDPFVLASYEKLSSSTPIGITYLCNDKELDFVIDALRLPGKYSAFSDDMVAGRTVRYYLYDCRVVRLARNAG